MRRGFSVLLILMFMPWAGCLESLADTGECTVHLPAVTAGDTYLYEANGSLAHIYTTAGAVTHWTAVDDTWTEGNLAFGGILTVNKGATLKIRIADQPIPRLQYQGLVRPAYQIAYEVKDPAHEPVFHYVDEWMDAESGDLVAASLRATYDFGDDQDHLIRLMRDGRAPLFISGALPSELEAGHRIGINSAPEVRGGPRARAERIEGGAALDGSVQRTELIRGVCHAFVEIEYSELRNTRSEIQIQIRATYRDGRPLPVEYTEHYPPSFGYLDMKLVLAEYRGANGAALPEWNPPSRQNGSLKTQIAPDGFLPYTKNIFPTTFAEAEQAIRADEVAATWLNARADATLLEVRHVMGDPSTDAVDQWEITWADNEKALLTATATKRRSLLPDTPVTKREEIQVTTKLGDKADDLPGPVTPRIALDDMDKLSRTFYKEPLEFLSCDFFRNDCWFGSHNVTGWPKAGETGGGLPQPGLMIFLEAGWLFMEQSYAQRALDDAAAPEA